MSLFGFDVKTVPIDPAPQTSSESASDKYITTSADPAPHVDSDTEEYKSASDVEGNGSESGNLSSKAKKSGLGFAHWGER